MMATANRQSDQVEKNISDSVEGRDSLKDTWAEEDQEDLETFLRRKEKEYEQRARLVRRVCEEGGEVLRYGSYSKMRLNRLRWLNARELIMCFNAKVGTSTWMNLLMDVAAPPDIMKNSSNHHRTAELHLVPPYPRKSQQAFDLMDKYSKIMIVRDPFARIVSAYRNKIAGSESLYVRVRRKILNLFRDPSSNNTDSTPTFEEFVKFLILTTTASDNIQTKKMVDRHWFPYYANCGVCDLNYTIIGKIETASEDIRYISTRFNLVSRKPEMKNRSPTSSDEEAISYFKDLPLNLKNDLYERYRVDFRLFGYNVSKYLDGR
ncbi:carbohydrate sulfotransferase 11-like [Oratosquilla oratoria]|uniref:carbohydrate sulfotransferase 11-like n=1 Tax=Oratosquilla oratoria TaxID=337810 RepID=UPI003F77486D